MGTARPKSDSVSSPWTGLSVGAAIAGLAWSVAALLRFGPGPLPALPVSPMVLAIFFGVGLAGMVARYPRCEPGLALAHGLLLKTAVALIGLRLSLGEVWTMGGQALPLVVLAITTALLVSLILYYLLATGARLAGLLTVGTAICGASAIAALAPAIRASPAEVCYAIACIALFGLIATVAYPLILPLWLDDPALIGLVMGSAIHDTAQVMAAASAHQQIWAVDGTLETATVSKLLRNTAMVVVIPAAAWIIAGRNSGQRVTIPYFIAAFLALAAVRSLADTTGLGETNAWQVILTTTNAISQFLFAMAMAALALTIRPRDLVPLGWRPALVAALVAAGMLAVTTAWAVGFLR